MRKLPDNIAPAWLVVHVLGTLFIAATLATAREHSPWVWAGYGVSAACWLAFTLLELKRTRLGLAAVMLALTTLLSGALVGCADDSSALIISIISVGRFASLITPSVAAILAVGVTDMVLAMLPAFLAQQPFSDTLIDSGVLLLLLLLGLNRRQYELRAYQAEELLTQTELAQEEHARAAALDERNRIAREIHDVLAHSLGALGVQLELAEALLEKSDVDTAMSTVRRSRRLAATGLAEARNAVTALRRDVPSLAAAVTGLVAAHRADHATPVRFDTTGTERALSSAAAVSLAAIAREALTNAAKHAPGEPIAVTLDFDANAVRLEVRNAAAEAEPGEGFGLTGMRERLALAGGTLSSGRRNGEWIVTAEVPE
ncbi:sensor histidine kinase [Amycolatopsis minnesotensis]|uniref:histidine kinase n=1 Tax=Amycolatopsis minnesotensis TaxID=337894 RepID=A0ABN2SD04_9PSEU